MINHVRQIISQWEVSPYTHLRAADHRGWAYDRLSHKITAATNYTIAGGPFRGMSYFGPPGIPIVDQTPMAKLVGSYEAELHPWIERLASQQFHTVVNIGGAEGYYAVGLARRMPDARIVYFDTLVAARKACKSLSEQNGVSDRMQLRGFCGLDALFDIQLGGSLIICDCAGAELALLDAALYPSLAQATLLVETHDYFDTRITPRLNARFGQTHSIEYVTAAPRNVSDYSILSRFDAAEAQLAVDENRRLTRDGKPQQWALLTPLSVAPAEEIEVIDLPF